MFEGRIVWQCKQTGGNNKSRNWLKIDLMINRLFFMGIVLIKLTPGLAYKFNLNILEYPNSDQFLELVRKGYPWFNPLNRFVLNITEFIFLLYPIPAINC